MNMSFGLDKTLKFPTKRLFVRFRNRFDTHFDNSKSIVGSRREFRYVAARTARHRQSVILFILHFLIDPSSFRSELYT